MMNEAERKAYSRGYSTAHKWPEHRPPEPPQAIIAELTAALRSIRDECDDLRAQLEPGDQWARRLSPQIDKADGALRLLGAWLLSGDSKDTPHD